MFETWIESIRDTFVEETRALLRIRSVEEPSSDPKKPFGEGVAEALDFMLELGKQYGFRTASVDGYAGHIEWGEGEDYVAVLAHLDVVPEGNHWSSPPFAAEVKDGRIIARGAIDDKGPAMAAFYALRALAENTSPGKHRIRLILGLNEESGWKCMQHYFASEPQPICGFTPDAEFPIIFAEKGIMDVALSFAQPIRGDGWSLLQIGGGERSNMVPDRCVALIQVDENATQSMGHALSQMIGEGDALFSLRQTGERSWEVVSTGVSAHGSTPDMGVNAVVQLCRRLVSLPGGQECPALAMIARIDTSGKELGILSEDSVTGALTCNLGIISWDSAKGQIVCNIRYPIDRASRDLLASIQQSIASAGAVASIIDDKGPLYVDKNDPLVQILSRVYEDATGSEASLLAIGGGTYARAIKKGVAFGPVFPGQPELAHQKDESVAIDDLVACIEIYARALHELSRV